MKTIILVFVFLFSNLFLIAQQEGDLIDDNPQNLQQPRSQDPTYSNVVTPEEILVVYKNSVGGNDTSESIKDYYVEKRSIPSVNILGLDIPNSIIYQEGTVTLYQGGEDIRGSGNLGWRYVKDVLADTIERYLNNTYVSGHPLSEKIKYIVLCKGIPIKIRSLDYVWDTSLRRQASVSALLCLINQPDPNKNFLQLYGTSVYTQLNPVFQPDPLITMDYRFATNHFYNSAGWYMQYLVTWLNGDNYDDVIDDIDRFADPDLSGEETWILDDDPNIYYTDFSVVNQRLTNLDFVTNYDNTSNWITTNNGSVVGYVSSGVHAGMPADYILNTLDFDYSKGATFTTYESFNAWSFGVLTSSEIGQGQIADFIHMLGSGGNGHVYEPFASGVSREYNTFPAYAMGYSIVDAQYQGINYLAWQNLVVGDPLTTIAWGKQTTTRNINMSGTNLITGDITISNGDTITFAAGATILLKHNGFIESDGFGVLQLKGAVTVTSDSWSRGLLLADYQDHPELVWSDYPTGPSNYYKIYKKLDNGVWQYADSVRGHTWIDNSLVFSNTEGQNPTIVYYYVKLNGTQTSNTVNAEVNKSRGKIIPNINLNSFTYKLEQNYPNPFNPTTSINYSLKNDGLVSLKVYNILGQRVADLVNQKQESGYYSVNFNASNLPSGVYIYTIRTEGFTSSKKMLLIK